jgi:hypothetical protein
VVLNGLVHRTLRWMAVRDPEGEFRTQALLCTNLGAEPQKILCWFVMRWQLQSLLPHRTCEQHSERGFGRPKEAKMGRKVPFRCSVRLQGRLLRPFSDSFMVKF